ncbi:MAG: hypothetical protein IJ571_06070 [Ruminococcus sp.]|nr:hypothetical protein [Ruminococcus sp.]
MYNDLLGESSSFHETMAGQTVAYYSRKDYLEALKPEFFKSEIIGYDDIEINSVSFIVNAVSSSGTILCLADSIITTKVHDTIVRRLLDKMCYNPTANCVISHTGVAALNKTNFQKEVFDYFSMTKENNISVIADKIFKLINQYAQPISLQSDQTISFVLSGYDENLPVCYTIDYSADKFVMQRFSGNFFVVSGIESYKKIFLTSNYSKCNNNKCTYENLVDLYRSIDKIKEHFPDSDTVGGWLKTVEFSVDGVKIKDQSIPLSCNHLSRLEI